MGKRPSATLIGAFVVGAVTLAVTAIVTFGSGQFFRHTQRFVLYFSGSLNGLEKGAPVKFRGVPIGSVKEIRLRIPGQPEDETRIPVYIDVDQDRLADLGLRMLRTYDPDVMQQLIDRGLRAQLQLQSIITGVLYIGLDLFPGTPVVLALPADRGLEIPTLPTALEQAQVKVQKILERLSKVDLDAFVRSVTSAVDGVTTLVNSPDLRQAIVSAREALDEARTLVHNLEPQVGPLATNVEAAVADMRAASQRLDATLADLQRLAAPDAPLVYGLTSTLADLDSAARSVRELADYLNRNPNSVLTGRAAE